MTAIFLNSLKKLGHFSDDELQALEKAFQYKELKKGDLVLQKGTICSAFYFIAEGAMIHYKINNDMEEAVTEIYTANDWAFDHKSLTTRQPSENYSKVYEDSRVFELRLETAHRLIAQSPSFLQIGRIFGGATARMELLNDMKTPDEKYLYLLKNKPEIIQKLPQKIIASYLKISPETLSRVRKRILRKSS